MLKSWQGVLTSNAFIYLYGPGTPFLLYCSLAVVSKMPLGYLGIASHMVSVHVCDEVIGGVSF